MVKPLETWMDLKYGTLGCGKEEGKNQRDYADDAFNGSYFGLGCSQCYKIAAFDPSNITDSTIDEIEANEKWSKGQIRRFIRSMRIDDLELLSKKDSQFLGVGKVEARMYFAKRSRD